MTDNLKTALAFLDQARTDPGTLAIFADFLAEKGDSETIWAVLKTLLEENTSLERQLGLGNQITHWWDNNIDPRIIPRATTQAAPQVIIERW